jgi:hypothetical protein
MKRDFVSPLDLLAPGLLAACLACRVSAQVYSQGIYSGGTAYYNICSTTLSFAPYHYNLTEMAWREDEKGLAIMDIGRKPAPSDVSRQCLEVESGSEDFFMPLDSGPVRPYKSRDDPPIIKGSGDFAPVVTQHSTNRGGRAVTNALPVVQASWIYGSRTNEDIFVLEGDHFVEVQNLLEHAYGKPDGAIHSFAPAGGYCCSINYTPTQIGVFLNLTRALNDMTIISIYGKDMAAMKSE